MHTLVDAILRHTGLENRRLCIATDPAGLLADGRLEEALAARGIFIVRGTSLALRLHFETEYKDYPERRYIYMATTPPLPDILREASRGNLSLSALFPFFGERERLASERAEVLDALMRLYPGRVAPRQCAAAIEEARRDAERIAAEVHAAEYTAPPRYDLTAPDWDAGINEAIRRVSQTICRAACDDEMALIAPLIESANAKFQTWLDANYFAQLNSSPLLHPASVDKILPYIDASHPGNDEKVALVVVDGMAYWQWLILKESLAAQGVATADGATLAWLPSITSLSRQAIFRGEFPRNNYQQNPASEKRLWQEYWHSKGHTFSEIQYLDDSMEFAIDDATRRLALVTVEIDEKMHASREITDLALLTRRWAGRFAPKIAALQRAGFDVYITADHGNVSARGRRRLTSQEKVALYADGSRGKRHLIFTDRRHMLAFKNGRGKDLQMMAANNWLAMRDDASFDSAGAESITHGGCHFLEVAIPFIKIENIENR